MMPPAMRLFALRGATSIDRDEASLILDGTTVLLQEILERNALTPTDVVSCIFTCTQDLTAEYPAVAARAMGFNAGPAAVHAGDGRARLDVNVLCVCSCTSTLIPATRSATSTTATRAACASTSLGAVDGDRVQHPHSRHPVVPAADGYALGDHVALLASNESPEAPLPEVVEAAQRAVAGANRYPDPSASLLRSRLSDRYGVRGSRIALGNGSCEILLAAGQALLEPGAELLDAWPSFSMYPQLAAASGARAVTVPVNDRHEHDLDAMLGEITAATRLVIVCNPNNPTSTALPFERIRAFVSRCPSHVAVIVDEAYCEYSTLDDPDATLDLLDDHPNLVLLRTFSKVYGLAGLRVGFGLCGSEDFVGAVNQVRQPFFVQRRRAGRGGRGAEARRRRRRARRACGGRPHPHRGGPRRDGDAGRGVAGELRLVRPPGGRRRAARSSAR